jgi:hypothetical protein
LAVENRFQRTVSLPIGQISRHSALGSHAPFDISGSKDIEADGRTERTGRPRRATLPSIVGTPEPFDSSFPPRQSISGQIDPANIGYAVTSGSNPRRRSRSADAYYNSKSHRMSPIQWRQQRRRSDEIRYWRASIDPVPNVKVVEDEKEVPEPELPEAVPVEDHEEDEIEEKQVHEDDSEKEEDNRDTFDFGVFASTIQQEENISMEERMMTVEVKLMDLEYAIAKLQPPTLLSVPEATPQPESSRQGRLTPSSAYKSQLGSDITTNGSISTQPTNPSLISPPSTNRTTDDPFIESKARPMSTATMKKDFQPISPVQSERNYDKRNSITNLTIDHFTSLIGLIRREQAARHRLEDQIVELQREISRLKQQYSPTGVGYARPKVWASSRRMPSYEDTTSTDDGYQDVYETPVEQRREYEGAIFPSPSEGEAF